MSAAAGKPKKDAFAAMMAARAAKATVKPKKKCNPQRKIKSYFRPKKNSLGYPMKHCKYQPVEGDYMYQPPWYGQSHSERFSVDEIIPRAYCKECKLDPCIAVEEEHSMSRLGLSMIENMGKTPRSVRIDIAYRMERKRRRLFNLDLDAPMVHKRCVSDFCGTWFPDKEGL